MDADYERRKKRVCYQKKLKYMFGSNWKSHWVDEDCENYVVGKTKVVEQLDKETGKVIQVFNSVAAAERAIKVPVRSSAISKVCRGEEPSAYGFRWRYA